MLEIGFVIVYRIIMFLNDLKVFNKIDFDDGCLCFEFLNSEDFYNYYYLICIKCGKVEEVEDDLFESLED